MNLREFRPGRPGVLGLVVAGCALWLSAEQPGPSAQVPVEVRGEVPRPGWIRQDAPTVRSALREAGVEHVLWPDAPLEAGARITVEDGPLRVERSPLSLALGQPLPLNTTSATELEALPGVGPSLAAAIVSDREARGPFSTLDELDRVRGVGPAKLAALRPYLAIGP